MSEPNEKPLMAMPDNLGWVALGVLLAGAAVVVGAIWGGIELVEWLL